VPLIFVTDVVQGLLLGADHERALGQAYNITNDQFLTQAEFLTTIAEELGVAPPRIHVPYDALYVTAYIAERLALVPGYWRAPVVTRHGVALYGADSRLSIEKARRELGFVPRVPLREGVRCAVAWYQEQQQMPAISVVTSEA
jgi:nucleoside-diphosphate-sugar epimerase